MPPLKERAFTVSVVDSRDAYVDGVQTQIFIDKVPKIQRYARRGKPFVTHLSEGIESVEVQVTLGKFRSRETVQTNEGNYKVTIPDEYLPATPGSGGNVKSNSQTTERLLAFGFGVVFVVVMLAIALFVPNPTPTQWFTFRVVLALAAAGVGALLPGLISVTAGPYVKAGGALALFVLVYWFNPAKLVTAAPPDSGLHLSIPSLGKPFDIQASMVVSGNQIERKTIPHPLSKDTDKGAHSFYTESNGGPVNSHLDVCPMAETGWVVDTEAFDGFDSGMTDRAHVTANGSNYWEVSKLGGGCLRLYCDGRNGSSNVYIANVLVREKRAVQVESCHPAVQDTKQVKPGEEQQLSLDVVAATGNCVDAKIKTRIDIKDPKGNLLVTKYLEPNGKEEVFDGALVLQLSPSGLVDVQYRIQSVNP
jgi:hypothetical protein